MIQTNPFRESILAPFRLIWEILPPRWAIPVTILFGIAFAISFAGMMHVMFYDPELSQESQSEAECEYKFYPEDFEQ